VGIAIEVAWGAVVDTCMENDFSVFSINPKQVDRFRDRYTVAGAKDDSRDARVLASALRTDPNSFKPGGSGRWAVAFMVRQLCFLANYRIAVNQCVGDYAIAENGSSHGGRILPEFVWRTLTQISLADGNSDLAPRSAALHIADSGRYTTQRVVSIQNWLDLAGL
jgi:hypothetical protein